MDYTVALAQIKPKLGCVADNLAMIEQAAEQGIREGAGLVVFPELALTGYFLKDLVPDVALSLNSPEIEKIAQFPVTCPLLWDLSRCPPTTGFSIHLCTWKTAWSRHLHRKVYLPTYGMFDEQRYLARGEQFRAFDTKFGRIGMLICEDMWHLSAPYILAMDGATTIICLSSSPGRGITADESLGSTSAWQKLTSYHRHVPQQPRPLLQPCRLRGWSKLLGRVGMHRPIGTSLHSRKDTGRRFRTGADRGGGLATRTDLFAHDAGREPVCDHERAKANREGEGYLMSSAVVYTPLLRKVLVGFIREEVKKVGLSRVVLGLSGGIDSALVAYLAAEALGGRMYMPA